MKKWLGSKTIIGLVTTLAAGFLSIAVQKGHIDPAYAGLLQDAIPYLLVGGGSLTVYGRAKAEGPLPLPKRRKKS